MRRLYSLALVPMVGLLAFPAADAVKVASKPRHDPNAAIIEGNVQSEAGAPLNGAQVFIEGKNLGAQASAEGWYRITVPEARIGTDSVTLTVKLIGYRQASRRILLHAGEKRTENFTLKTNPLRLGEVVVTGEGTAPTSGKLGMSINEQSAGVAGRLRQHANERRRAHVDAGDEVCVLKLQRHRRQTRGRRRSRRHGTRAVEQRCEDQARRWPARDSPARGSGCRPRHAGHPPRARSRRRDRRRVPAQTHGCERRHLRLPRAHDGHAAVHESVQRSDRSGVCLPASVDGRGERLHDGSRRPQDRGHRASARRSRAHLS